MRCGNVAQMILAGMLLAVAGLTGACSSSLRMQEAPSSDVAQEPAAAHAALAAIPGGVPAAHEELWIIQKAAPWTAQAQVPGGGSLMVQAAGVQPSVTLTPAHTDIRASIAGPIATVEVTQQFQNPYGRTIEAVYVFPLPEDAGISDFVMTVGERKIRGIIRERREAEEIYLAAKAQGYMAALLTQERPNVFTQAVTRLAPGKQVDIRIRYYHTLAYVDGWYEWGVPLAAGTRGRPGERKGKTKSGQELTLSVQVDAGVGLETLECPTHRIVRRDLEGGRVLVTLAEAETIPDRDFVLRYKVAGKTVKSALMVSPGKEQAGGYFAWMLYPPVELSRLPRRPLEIVLVIDPSTGAGPQAKATALAALRQLRPEDRFQIATFGGDTLAATALEATEENLRRAAAYVQHLPESRKTRLERGLIAALAFPHDPARTRVAVFLTDGGFDQEPDVGALLHAQLASSQVLAFGMGGSVNRRQVASLARCGQGAVAYVDLLASPTPTMEAYLERISHPALTQVQVALGSMQAVDMFPRTMPDLYVGRPVVLMGRYTGSLPATVTVRGKAGEMPLTLTLPVKAAGSAALPAIWARQQLADYYARSADEKGPWEQTIKHLALTYGLVSPYTAFLVVDAGAGGEK